MDANRILYNAIYVVIMKRWGCDEGHHYILGVYTTQDKAKQAAEENREDRGGKYEWVIECHSIDDAHHMKGIYKVDRSHDMRCLTDKESKQMFKDTPTDLDEIEKYNPSDEWFDYCRKLDEVRLKEELTQYKKWNDDLCKENTELRQKLNERKEV